MASKRTGRKFLTDNVVRARRAASPPVQHVTIISGGVRYAPGKAPARCCPAGTVRLAQRRAPSNPMLRKV